MHDPDRVDVALHIMAAHATVRGQRAFEIDALAGLVARNASALHGFILEFNAKAGAITRHHGQADAINSNAVAELHGAGDARGADRQAGNGKGAGERGDGANFLDDAGKHARAQAAGAAAGAGSDGASTGRRSR